MERRLTYNYKDIFDTWDPIDVYDNDYSKINFQNVLRKLAHYEDLEEQGRLIELPCLPDEEVWISNKRFGTHKMMYASREAIVRAIEAGNAIGYTKESAEAKLKEMESAE